MFWADSKEPGTMQSLTKKGDTALPTERTTARATKDKKQMCCWNISMRKREASHLSTHHLGGTRPRGSLKVKELGFNFVEIGSY